MFSYFQQFSEVAHLLHHSTITLEFRLSDERQKAFTFAAGRVLCTARATFVPTIRAALWLLDEEDHVLQAEFYMQGRTCPGSSGRPCSSCEQTSTHSLNQLHLPSTSFVFLRILKMLVNGFLLVQLLCTNRGW